MTTSALIAVWTWGSASMLMWGLAAAIPVVLHFWSRRRFEEVPWGAMEFLLAAVRKNARRLRIEQLLLLAARTALLIVFAVAIADPVLSWQAGESITSAPTPVHYLFVVDTSYSMAYRSRDQTRLDAAKRAVQSVLDSSRPGDGFTIILLQNPPQIRIAEASSDRSEVARQLAAVDVSHGGADLFACLNAIHRQLEITEQRHPQLERKQVIFLTDLGRTTWDAVTRSDCQAQLEQLDKKCQLSLINVAEGDATNVFIARLNSDRPFLTVGETARFEAEIRSLGNALPVNCRVEFLVDGHIVKTEQVIIPANGRAMAASDVRCDKVADIPIEVRLSPDSLTIDNERWMVLPVHKTLNVLCIQGEPEAADYVALALNPSGSDNSPIRATVGPESSLIEQSLERYDCLMLCNLAQFGRDERNALSRYVLEGGGLVTVLGDRVQADSYNAEFGDKAGPSRLLPARLEEMVRDEVRLLDPLDYKHAIVAPFRGHERAGLLTVPTWCYYRLRPMASSAEIALAFDNQHPAIVAETIGRGRSILVATALSPSSTHETADGRIPWSALPTWPSFPPLVDGLVRNATTGRDWPRNVEVSSPIQIHTTETVSARARITLPDRSTRQIDMSHSDGFARSSFTETLVRGIYEVAFTKSGEKEFASQQRFAVNVDPSESDLRQLPPTMLPLQLQPHVEMQLGAPFLPPPSGVTLFRHLLLAVVFLLVIEGALAGWLGRRAA